MKRAKVQRPKRRPESLVELWKGSLRGLRAAALIREHGPATRRGAGKQAFLFWGKAAPSAALAFKHIPGPRLVISPASSGHPLPDKRSFEMGARLLDFFDHLGRSRIAKLTVVLSGGASSLAWVRPAGLSERELREKLGALYRQPLTIRELNRRRCRLCLLKCGGAARWLGILAPKTRARVYVIGDVAPFGMEVVGSGPFATTGLSRPAHVLLADNSSLARAVRRRARERILDFRHSALGSERSWARDLSAKARQALAEGKSGLLIRGGEPQVSIPLSLPLSRRRGGRQCQLASLLLLGLWEELRGNRLEILCASSDGSDGSSGAAAVHLSARGVRKLSGSLQRQLKMDIERFDTAPFLSRHGFLIPSFETGTNLQDIVLIRISSRMRQGSAAR